MPEAAMQPEAVAMRLRIGLHLVPARMLRGEWDSIARAESAPAFTAG